MSDACRQFSEGQPQFRHSGQLSTLKSGLYSLFTGLNGCTALAMQRPIMISRSCMSARQRLASDSNTAVLLV